MKRSLASAAVVGTSVALAAAFLTQPTPHATSGRDNDIATPAQTAQITAALRTLARDERAPVGHPTTLAVCHDCTASRTLVRVLLRRYRHGLPLSPLTILTDRTWPALDTLARHSQSSVVRVARLAERVHVTPVALRTDRRHAVLGVPEVLALLSSSSSPTNGARP